MDKIRLKIDVTKIDKARLFKGKSGTYLDATLIPSPNNKFGDDYMIVQDIGREEREKGHKGAILGNGKILVFNKREAGAAAGKPADDPFADSAGDEIAPF